jgi:S1-C subfamily serine protease
MDAYSKIVTEAVGLIKNAVVKIDIFKTQRGKSVPAGSGSGFIFSSDGLIFTNSHVVKGAEKIRVTLLDGSEEDAFLVGDDPDTDLAVIKTYASGFSVARMGDSDQPQHRPAGRCHRQPLRLPAHGDHGRSQCPGPYPAHHLRPPRRQRDPERRAAEPGQLGRADGNAEGEVIGVNTAVIRGAQGLSFAVGINTAKDIAGYLIKDGKVVKAYLGLVLQEINLNPRIVNYYGLKHKKGLMVVSIEQNSPASRSSLREGDIIIQFEETPLHTTHDLFKQLSRDRIDRLSHLTIIRNTQKLDYRHLPGRASSLRGDVGRET